ncbi:hypothetical protein GCM10009733_033720 [Nonomuraea maheshkhaliensis]|uniref:Uncharacterized protein n=1 Tax=Nonomuraea maheshkhaliensis TaxID=419590 RepID=A0ABN2F7D8_9ACTN
MQRGSDKHGPRPDEQQKHETEGMADLAEALGIGVERRRW